MFTPHWSDTKFAQPSAAGDWAPGAYDPQSGYLFFATEVATRQFNLASRTPIEGSREYGLITALDSRTNKRVWQSEVPYPAGFGADAPAATYQIDGEQYVAIAAGGSRDGSREARGDLVWSFKLGGRLNPLNGPPAPRTIVGPEVTRVGGDPQ
jgi:glucose dehydrogenase